MTRFLPVSASLLVAIAIAGLPADLRGQRVSCEFSPNPAPPGGLVTITGTDATGAGANLPTPCGWLTVHQGSQTGPVVPLGIACIQVITPVAPNGSFQITWDQLDNAGNQVPPGEYWVRVRVWNPTLTSLSDDWFCLSIQGPQAPALTAAGPAVLGQSTSLQITAPTEPGALYVAAASFSANQPVSFFGLQSCLSLPAFLDPVTAPIGFLDASGSASGLALTLPNAPLARFQGLHLQALVLGASGPVLTNALSFTLR